jgi:hypothetical protein
LLHGVAPYRRAAQKKTAPEGAVHLPFQNC